ncbi:MAG TPA: hypothetical protein VFS78_10945 [Vicinamibacteria bacterium]|nr:hypothetical protein [Vicinamibacteria bacterium]
MHARDLEPHLGARLAGIDLDVRDVRGLEPLRLDVQPVGTGAQPFEARFPMAVRGQGPALGSVHRRGHLGPDDHIARGIEDDDAQGGRGRPLLLRRGRAGGA